MLFRRSYYMLLASLPALPPHFDVQRCPISWPGLEHRLRLLEPDDRATLDRLVTFFAWDRQPLERTDEEVCRRLATLLDTLKSPLVRQIVQERFETRTIISALRRRQRGDGPPPVPGWLGDGEKL